MGDYENYNLEKYCADVEKNGLRETWNSICSYVLANSETPFLNVSNFGELYEIGLAVENKKDKKSSGQYYTPHDVSMLMSQMLAECPGLNICDIGCGTGNLILAYLECIGVKKAMSLLESGSIYIYDMDQTALNICRTSIALRYGEELSDKIHTCCCDFLSKKVKIPPNSKSISNPPYAAITEIGSDWEITHNLHDSNELYSAFMEKIFKQSTAAVVISPFSFISGTKFYELRKVMCEYGHGFIYSFDNVPANIFGRKHGVFNTNHANSVRPSITQYFRSENDFGYQITPLIRFKSSERKKVIDLSFLKNLLPAEKQIVSGNNKRFAKVGNELSEVYKKWIKVSNERLIDLCDPNGEYTIYVPNTCRYYTVGSPEKLSRSGQIELRFNDYDKYCYTLCLINSSFCYWWWRIYDGGITYSKSLLDSLPVFYDKISADDKLFFESTIKTLSAEKDKYRIVKNNIGIKENIKYPHHYRNMINNKFFEILGIDATYLTSFEMIHSNCVEGDN